MSTILECRVDVLDDTNDKIDLSKFETVEITIRRVIPTQSIIDNGDGEYMIGERTLVDWAMNSPELGDVTIGSI